LLQASWRGLLHADGLAIDPMKAWATMMSGEKPGGHGERCVAVGALDMAIWDLAAKARGSPLFQFLRQTFNRRRVSTGIPVYAGGGYRFPDNDLSRLRDEMQHFRGLGFTTAKMKIGTHTIAEDTKRIETVLDVLGDGRSLAVDAMNAYSPSGAHEAANILETYYLRWFEDICDPLDFETHRRVAGSYRPPISVGEAVFSAPDALNLIRYAGLRRSHDVLTFDPAHCYGIPEFVRIIELFEHAGWSSLDFQPHGGHLYSLHLSSGLGLGGCECNPHNFQPFGGFADGTVITNGRAAPPNAPGIGFEARAALIDLFRTLI
jgi:D(-)-tartrate dehydratase